MAHGRRDSGQGYRAVRMMRQKIIGVFPCGFEDVELVLRSGNGAEFYNCPGRGEIARIKIGADVKEWRDVVSALVHEATEYTMNRLRCRFDRSYDMGNDASSYLFVLDHPTFSDCCARVATFLVEALPQLSREWDRWRKRKKSTPKGKRV